tara:strand:+ start:130 stop:342 length:213 start_codon:yes stop_codon:yes gene_type:complete
MINKNFEKLSKKQLLDMVDGYKREIKKSERFYREEYKSETKSFIEAIEEIGELLRVKHKTNIDLVEIKKS